MKPFLVEKRRLIDLAALLVIDTVMYFLWDSIPLVCLFSFGFIWNWTAGQNLEALLANPRYRFSMVKFVGNVQALALKPFLAFPRWIQILVKSAPAGIFWGMVIFINDSSMPWWMTFIGSLVFELLQLNSLPPLPLAGEEGP